MKTKLNKSWMPSEGVLNLAKSKGMPIEDWLYHLIPEWKLHWIGSGEKRPSWDSTFWNWAKSQWEKVDKSRMYRKPETLSDALIKGINEGWIEPPGKSAEALSIERFEKMVEDYFK